jgi:hypothetical protein
MATQAMCTSYKAELMQALHNHTQTSGHVFKCAMYTSSSTMSKATTVYSNTNEITNTAVSAAGGLRGRRRKTSRRLPEQDASYTSWSVNPSWSSATFTANSCLIYNSSSGNRAVCVLTFGGNQQVTAGTFTIQLPTNGEGCVDPAHYRLRRLPWRLRKRSATASGWS